MIGKRLKLARESAGLTLRQLGEKIDNLVSYQAIQKYETDETMPGSKILRALANALGVSERYLLNPNDMEITGIEFREGIEGGARELGEVKAKLLSHVEKYLDIERLVPGAEAAWALPTGFPYPVTRAEDVELAASRLRSTWGLGNQSISHLPELLEEHGIKVIALRLNPRNSGILCTVRRGNQPGMPVIAINSEEPGERQKMGLAHELAHLILDLGAVRGDIEAICDRFARAFLLLHDAFISAVGKARKLLPVGELFQLKAIFGMAAAQIVKRCVELGIIGGSEERRLKEIFTESGWLRSPNYEPNPILCEEPTRFTRLCLRALSEDIITDSRAAELLGMPTRELASLCDSASGAFA